MSDSTEETYSAMFSSLRHPARRKILKMLSEKEMTFSQMLDELEIPGSHLTYHLENLGEFLIKMDDGKYKLSSIGDACCAVMKGAEEVPNRHTEKFSGLTLKWKTILAIFAIGIILLATTSGVQYYFFNQLSGDYETLEAELEEAKMQNQQIIPWSSAERAMTIIRDVAQIDTTKYETKLLQASVDERADLAGAVEEILKYSLTTSESKIDLVLRFRNDHFSLYQLSVIEGIPPFDPIYIQPQSSNILTAAKGLIERYKSISNDPYLEDMTTLLASATETDGEQTLGNVKLKVTTYGDNSEVLLMYTANEYDYSAKSIRLIFQENVLQELTDDFFLYTVSNLEVPISRDEAIQTARNAAKNFEWSAGGEQVTDFNVLSEPVSAVFFPHPKNEGSLALAPYWFVTLYLDQEYPGGVNSIAVGIWADTGEPANIQAVSSQITT
ncbi:winged helix-turn-helix transcriptional regulator [Candidatus Bathyarchaeota archaeon]|nr:winged helix-turn-helix transcriptional regulator [Candidatus Bathyarchaeota archaeon]